MVFCVIWIGFNYKNIKYLYLIKEIKFLNW